VKDVRREMGRSLKVFLFAFVGAEAEVEVLEWPIGFDWEGGEGIERTMRFVIGSAV
jgi:hypothetical protein